MNKKEYKKAEIKIIESETVDIIAISGIPSLFNKGNNLPSAGQAEFNSEWLK